MRLGSDPEMFLLEKATGNVVSVCGMIGADKWSPHQYEDMPEGYTVQEDNVAVEFGVPPASSAAEFVKHIKAVQKRFLKDHKHLTFSKLSCIMFPAEQLKHPSALNYGIISQCYLCCSIWYVSFYRNIFCNRSGYFFEISCFVLSCI